MFWGEGVASPNVNCELAVVRCLMDLTQWLIDQIKQRFIWSVGHLNKFINQRTTANSQLTLKTDRLRTFSQPC
jgi:hypothetical protein